MSSTENQAPKNTRRGGQIQIDTQEEDYSAQDRTIALAGDVTIEELRDQLNAKVGVDVGAPDFKDYAENMAFMEEKMLVRVHQSSDKNAEPLVDVYCNGTPQRFLRGQWVVARRKFVEVLARAKPFGVTTPEFTDGNGDRATAINIQAGLRYPFEVQDNNPRGQAWLQRILQEA